MMSAQQDTYDLMRRLAANGLNVDYADANALRRAQLTLHRWDEQKCGDGDQWKSWAIERDEATDLPYMAIYPHSGSERRAYRIPDREGGALRRVAAICGRIGAHYFHQTDPRGCALYVGRDALTDIDYSRGVGV